MSVFTSDYTLAAGQVIDVPIEGTRVYVLEAPQGPVGVDFQDNGNFVTAPQQTELEAPQPFTKFRLRNEAGAQQTVRVVAGFGRVRRDSFQSADTAAKLTTRAAVSLASGLNTDVVAANSGAIERFLRLADSASARVWVGDADVDVDRGIPLDPGAHVFLATQGALSVHNEGSGGDTLTVAETENV